MVAGHTMIIYSILMSWVTSNESTFDNLIFIIIMLMVLHELLRFHNTCNDILQVKEDFKDL